MKYGYLGPKGTFSHSAALHFGGEKQIVPFSTIYAALNAVQTDEINYAVVPVENSTEGSVNATLDSLIFDFDLYINAQLNMPISENLMVKHGTKINDITKVVSHNQPLAQCSGYLRQNLPNVPTQAVSSTAAAMKLAAESSEPLAAIGNKISAKIYGLEILKEDIQDDKSNFTQFALVSKKNNETAENCLKTTVAFSVTNQPGGLLNILTVFQVYDVNMTKIISRPMRSRSEEYVFFIDIENTNKEDIASALKMIKRKSSFYKLLGTYSIQDLR